MAERMSKTDKPVAYVDELRDLQNQYRELSDLHEKQKVYAEQLSEIVRALQREADVTIPLSPDVLSQDCSAAYLVSDAVVVMFDIHREMTSKSLSRFPPHVVVSVIEECASELGRQLSKKREAESEKVETLEKVLREISKAHGPYRTGLGQSQPELERVPPTQTDRSPIPTPIPVTERREVPPPVERREAAPVSERRSAPPVVEKREVSPPVEKKEATRAVERKEVAVVEKRPVEQPRQDPVEIAPQAKSGGYSFNFKGSYGNSKDEEATY